MFVRHGEKPAPNGPPHGVNHHGEHDEHSLSVRGWTRAGALARLFSSAPTDAHPVIVVPERIVATKSTGSYKSRREVDTATPLAGRLGCTVDVSFDHAQVEELSRSVLADSRPTLIVWHHGSMANLVRTFPIENGEDVPRRWPDDRFDLIWVLVRQPGAAQYRFTALPQALLEGDARADGAVGPGAKGAR